MSTLNFVYIGSALVILVEDAVVEIYHSFTSHSESVKDGDPYSSETILAIRVTDVGLFMVFLWT